MKRFTAVVVGGGAGGRCSLGALSASDRFDLVGVADLRADIRESLAADYPGIRTFATHTEMFTTVPTDVVCVSTYAPSHEQVTMDAVELPLKEILVEKPLGNTVAAGRRILEACQSRRLPMAVPHGLLAKRTPLEIIERVQRGEIGALKLVEIEHRGWDIINAGIHWADFFVTLTGNEALASVLAQCDTQSRTYRDGMQVETESIASVATQSGVRLVMNMGDHVQVNADGKEFVFRLVGTMGMIEFWGWENAYRITSGGRPTELVIPEEMPVTGHQYHLENLAGMIDRGAADYSVAEGSLLALEICAGAYLSSNHRCKVTFPVDKFVPPLPNDWQPGEPYYGAGGGLDGRQL